MTYEIVCSYRIVSDSNAYESQVSIIQN